MSTPTRSYESPAREEAARRTRARIRAAAHELFVRDGYAATSMRAIAQAAGVSERMVYVAYPAKIDLFRDVMNVATAGDEEPVALRDRSPFQDRLANPDGRAVVASVAASATEILGRSSAVLMAAIESSGADPEMRALVDASRQTFADNMAILARSMRRHGSLRPGLSTKEAADILALHLSPHVHYQLCRQDGWPPARYRRFIERQLVHALLPDADADA